MTNCTVAVVIPDPNVTPEVDVDLTPPAITGLPDPASTTAIVVDWTCGDTVVYTDTPVVLVEWAAQGVSVLPPPSVVDIDLCVGVQGPPGPAGGAGPPGPPGPPGPAGGAPYVFTQSSSSAMWHIVHGFGSQPSVVIRRADGLTVAGFGTVYAADANTVDVYFGQPIAGVATLNF